MRGTGSGGCGERQDEVRRPFADDFIFASEVGGFLDTDNYRKRVLHKLARELELPKLTFQVIRRTIATLAQKKGTVKDVQVSCGTRASRPPPMFT
jgi:integrase